MELIQVNSHDEFQQKAAGLELAYLLLYKTGSEQSNCALDNLGKIASEGKEVVIFKADVSQVRDIHPKYNVTSVPTLLEFEKGKFVNVLKGCHAPGFYESFFTHSLYAARSRDEDAPKQKRVTVYTTPTCTWCNTLKTYLRRNNIRFTEIDVSRDMNAAQEMQRKSGQMGVPQTDIEGQIVVGFDKNRINSLLGIQAGA
ncbi:MAG: hypothetical protein Kow00127_25450 [Bacteroidales bacterium]